jgi:hypothetical protein
MHVPSRWNFLSRLARIIGALALAAALGGCAGAIKLGYNNLDELAFWWIDSHLDLNDEQDTRVREDLARLHRWHRHQELPQLADTLKSLEQLVAGTMTPAQACAFVPGLRARLQAIADRAEPAVVTLGLGLAPEQLKHLERKFQRTNKDFQKDWVRPEAAARSEKRFDQTVDRMEMIYGKLDDAQKAVIRAQIDKSQFDPRRVLDERQRRQQDLLQTLRKLAGQPIALDDARVQVRGYLRRLQESPDAAWRAYEQTLLQEGCATFSMLHNSTTPAQREAGVRRLRGYQRDLWELAAQK